MQVFHLYRTKHRHDDWDEFIGKIIVAANETRARQIANKNSADYEGEIWGDVNLVKCEAVDIEKEGTVLESFYAG